MILLQGMAAAETAREPLDELWTRRMLAGQYGVWQDGHEVPPGPWRRGATIESYPEGAAGTQYGIEIGHVSPERGGWDLVGGLVGRAETAGGTVELFARSVGRVHPAPAYGLLEGRDYTYELFLVVRGPGSGPGTLVKRWRFGPEELALTGGSLDRSLFRRSTRAPLVIDNIVRPSPGQRRRHFLEAYLDVDPSTRVATVSVIGLKRPFEDRVGLSSFLRP